MDTDGSSLVNRGTVLGNVGGGNDFTTTINVAKAIAILRGPQMTATTGSIDLIIQRNSLLVLHALAEDQKLKPSPSVLDNDPNMQRMVSSLLQD